MAEIIDPDSGEITSGYIRYSAQRNELFAALAKAQAKFEMAEKAGANPHFKSRYATLASVVEAAREPLAEHGLCVMQLPGNAGIGNIAVTTILGHASGQWLESVLYVAPVKFDAQSAGSVITYLRRYALMSVLGIAPEDDDGEAAVARPEGRSAPARDDKTEAARNLYRTLQTRIDEAKTLDELERAIPDPSRAYDMIHGAAPGTFDKLLERREAKRKALVQAQSLPQRVAEHLGA